MTALRMRFAAACMCMLFYSCADGQSRLTRVYSNFSFVHPVDLQAPPDGSDRIMIVSQPGRIYAIQNGAVPTMQLMLDLTDSVTSRSSELGLLGLAFHPRFSENGYLFVDYTAANPLRTVIARYTMRPPSSNTVDVSSRVVLLEIPQPYENHNGGCLAFGPDGYLYIGMGDGGSGGDPQNNAQNKKSLLGKILRIDVDAASGAKKYSIPADNPFKGNADAAEEVFAYGMRNPWRFSFDRVTKKLWVGDVGQDKYEEVDIVESGKNYGWRTMEGRHCYNPPTGCDQAGLELPVWEYAHATGGGWCITGGVVYRGSALPALYGKYVYADYVTQTIWALSIDAQGIAHNETLVENAGPIVSFGVDAANELYACSYDGKIFKMDKGTPVQNDAERSAFDFRLGQNYPNPFNAGTVLPFHIAGAVHATLTVVDILGRTVATLVDGMYQPGSYTAHWEPRNSASGVYVYRMEAGGMISMRKLVYQK